MEENFLLQKLRVVFDDYLHQQTVEGSTFAYNIGLQKVKINSEKQAKLYLEA